MKFPRRRVLAGLAGIPVAAHLPMAGRPARAQAELESVTLTISGGRTVAGVVAAPAVVPAPGLLLIHGSSGLNDMYKAFAPACCANTAAAKATPPSAAAPAAPS